MYIKEKMCPRIVADIVHEMSPSKKAIFFVHKMSYDLCMKCHVIFTKGSCSIESIEQLYVVALEVVAEHKKKSTCMGASVPESVGERRQA